MRTATLYGSLTPFMRNCSNTLAQLQQAANGDTMQYKMAASSPMYHTKRIRTKNQIMLHSHCVAIPRSLAVINRKATENYEYLRTLNLSQGFNSLDYVRNVHLFF